MTPLDLIIVGSGRAGGSIGLAAQSAGHNVVAVVTGQSRSVPANLSHLVVEAADLPHHQADLLIVGVRDDDIRPVVTALRTHPPESGGTVHLSGFTTVQALGPDDGTLGDLGSFHPLQTLPNATIGAQALHGAHVAITTSSSALNDTLERLATAVGLRPFSLSDRHKPAYHAAAACASNQIVEALAVARDLFVSAGVDPMVAQPLTQEVVNNVFTMGAEAALTGPVARGDRRTVLGHIEAAGVISRSVELELRLLTAALAIRARRHELADELLGHGILGLDEEY